MKLVTMLRRDLIDAVIVVAELRRRLVALRSDSRPPVPFASRVTRIFPYLIALRLSAHHRKAGDSERHRSQDVAVVKRHLQAFVEILVVHVVDAVHRMHVGARQPFHRGVELGHHVVVVEEVARRPAASGERL